MSRGDEPRAGRREIEDERGTTREDKSFKIRISVVMVGLVVFWVIIAVEIWRRGGVGPGK